MHYYEIHINAGRTGSYNIAIKSEHPLSDEEAVNKAWAEGFFCNDEDVDMVDYVGQLTEQEYNEI